MVYAPIAAFLVESFPSRVRYTSVSLPYHIGNGYFGGFLPLIAGVVFARALETPDDWPVEPRYAGLLCPVAVASITFVLGLLIALSAFALFLADRYVTPALNRPQFDVQWFFRFLALTIVLVIGAFIVSRRMVTREVATSAD